MQHNILKYYVIRFFKPSNFPKRKLSQDLTSKQDSLSYCANIVRQHDYENYLATLLMTKSLRSPTLVIRALNAEVARIQDQTRDPQIADMRLQFWQDTVNQIFKKSQDLSNIPANPVAQELFKVCSCYKLPRRYLERLVQSRKSILKTKYFQCMEDIENHSEHAVSSVYYLVLSIAEISNVHADHASSHLGKAQGIVNILRSIHVSNYLKLVSLPMDVLMKYSVSQESVLRGIDSDSIRNVVFEVASRANSHLQKARSIEVPKETHQIFLPAVAIEKYLKKLEKANFNIYDVSLQRGNPTLPFHLYYIRLLNKY
ncbi:NADH dehydrogenase (ubiquinone) complex I, assembly factor 6 isoform X1 [Leptidea sinapis]|uniref:NADH dehydrogenase (ubiquinone) complex I, assembly factor 6 isoform X1 n=2 Tax=Leptidea sinapis TaxID=189913 RepID=UPI0021C41EB0|nr:NADH dehydrogenase (ubiquinone) complex I, assembly factor 6 isoform X1 [Leptidea sinapis]